MPRLPSAVLATGFILLSFLSLFGGLILGSVTRGRNEMKGGGAGAVDLAGEPIIESHRVRRGFIMSVATASRTPT